MYMSPAATGRRREAVASALAINAFEGQTFDGIEMTIIRRYIDGEIDNETMRTELLALPLGDQKSWITPEPTPPSTVQSRFVPSSPSASLPSATPFATRLTSRSSTAPQHSTTQANVDGMPSESYG